MSAANPRQWRARFDDGSELLVTAWSDVDGAELVEVAVRKPGDRVWGPPVQLVEEER